MSPATIRRATVREFNDLAVAVQDATNDLDGMRDPTCRYGWSPKRARRYAKRYEQAWDGFHADQEAARGFSKRSVHFSAQ